MTEITGNIKRTENHLIDPLAFFGALVAAPLLVTLATFWILFIPAFALVMGGPIYLIFATPVLLWWLGRREPSVIEIGLLAFAANLAVAGGLYLFVMLEGAREPGFMAMFYLIFGSIFAPLWAGVFAWLYRRLRRPFFEQTI